MSDTQDQSRFTVEDAGTTTDAADLAGSGVGHAVHRDEDPVASADEVVRATDRVPAADSTSTTAATADESTAAAAGSEPVGQQAAPQQTAVAEDEPAAHAESSRGGAATQEEAVRQRESAQRGEPATAPAAEAPRTAHGDLSALADADIGHVFDQTNGVIERADGDSDGSAESDVLSASERSEDDPTVADAGVHGDGEVPEARRTGD